ncbi:uncharacterized protein DKFZp434B061-like [Eschrichtius robustus]|uniref:uncharacterized protein DKFZp434B061-like n=1 Tax=Eschrichtius robustus TaxID=9764 RepID=UPI0035C12CD9
MNDAEGSGSTAETQAAPRRREPSSLLLGLGSRGAGAAARALKSRGRCRRQIPARGANAAGKAAAAAPRVTWGAGKLREDNSSATKPLPRAAHGLRHLQPPLRRLVKEPARPGKRRGGSARQLGRARRTRGLPASRRAKGRTVPPPSLAPTRAAPPATPGLKHPASDSPARHDPDAQTPQSNARGPHPSDSTRPLPGKQPGSRGSTGSRAATLRPFPPHLRSAAAPHLLARSARPVGAHTDPPRAGSLRAAATLNVTATAAFSSSAQAPAASRGLRSEPHRGQSESHRLRSLHRQVPSLVRTARIKCHQRPFRSAPHFRPEPQSLSRSARGAAAAGTSRDWSGRPRESQTAPSGWADPRSYSCRAPGVGAPASWASFPLSLHLLRQLPSRNFPEGRKASQYKPRTMP